MTIEKKEWLIYSVQNNMYIYRHALQHFTATKIFRRYYISFEKREITKYAVVFFLSFKNNNYMKIGFSQKVKVSFNLRLCVYSYSACVYKTKSVRNVICTTSHMWLIKYLHIKGYCSRQCFRCTYIYIYNKQKHIKY